jgi:salicylate hydroxylase
MIVGYTVNASSSLTGFNIDIPRSLLAKDPELVPFLVENNFWVGDSPIAAVLPIPDLDDMMNLNLIVETGGSEEGKWDAHADLKEVRAKFSHFERRIQKLLGLAEAQRSYIWRFSNLPPLEKWSTDDVKMAIIGDAAHAMVPYAGQGASMCIEDWASLALCLGRAQSPADFPKILKAFEEIRKPRVERMVVRGRENARISHLSDGPEQVMRDNFMRSMPLGVPRKNVWDGQHIYGPPEELSIP